MGLSASSPPAYWQRCFFLASESSPQIYASQRPHTAHGLSTLLQQSGPAQKRMDGIRVGVLEVQGIKLRLILKIARDSGGALTAKLDVPDEGASDLPIDAITLQRKSLRFEAKNLGLSYEGTLALAESSLTPSIPGAFPRRVLCMLWFGPPLPPLAHPAGWDGPTLSILVDSK